MKHGLIFAFFAICFLSACANHKTHYFSSPNDAVIQAVSGMAEISNGGGPWSKAQTGDLVRAGARVRTAENGSATLNLGMNGGSVDVMPGSLLEIERLGPTQSDPDVLAVLSLLEGRVQGDTRNPPSHGKVVVRTRGGAFEIR
jgi:hypothetical protein